MTTRERDEMEQWEETIECAYCGADIPIEDIDPREIDNDEWWSQQAAVHLPSCEWVDTRAHRLPLPEVTE
jgi:hypothetical protein